MMPAEVRDFVNQYRSPESESSIVKDVPMHQLEQARRYMRVIEKLTGQRMRVIYRGPRYDYGRSWCLARDGKRFAIYFR